MKHFSLAGCPSCYNLVQVQVNNIRRELASETSMLNALINDPVLVNFSSRLTALDEQSDKLVAVTETNANLTTVLKSNLPQLSDLLNADSQQYTSTFFNSEIMPLLGSISVVSSQVDDASANVDGARKLLLSAYTSLTTAMNVTIANLTVTVDRITALNKLANVTTTGMEGNASALQAEAKQLASNAAVAASAANQSLTILEQIMSTQTATTDRLQDISVALARSQDILTKSQQALASALLADTKASNAKQNTSSLFYLPDVTDDWDAVFQLSRDADSLLQQAQNLQSMYSEASSNISDHNTTVELLRVSIAAASQEASRLLSRAQPANSTAHKFVEASQTTLNNAHRMLNTLRNFNGETTIAQDQAQQSLGAVATANETAEQLLEEANSLLTNHRQASEQVQDAADASQSALESTSAALTVRKTIYYNKTKTMHWVCVCGGGGGGCVSVCTSVSVRVQNVHALQN